MTRAELRAEVYRLLSLPSASFPTDRLSTTNIDRWLWLAACELVREARPVTHLSSESISLVAGTAEYTFSGNVLTFLDEQPPTTSGTPLEKTTLGQINQDGGVTTGDTVVWYEAGFSTVNGRRKVGFYPTPVASATCKFTFLVRPAQLTDAAYYDIPDEYQDAMTHWAAWFFYYSRIEQTEKDPSAYLQVFDKFRDDFRRQLGIDNQRGSRPRTPQYLGSQVETWMPV